jgi:ABC-type Na+ efflux pump permease subunit
MKNDIKTVLALTRAFTKRYFRDKTALFFTFVFPLVFLMVFGTIFGKSSGNWKLYSAEEKNRNNKYIPSLVIKAATEVVKMPDASVIDWTAYEKYCEKDYIKP